MFFGDHSIPIYFPDPAIYCAILGIFMQWSKWSDDWPRLWKRYVLNHRSDLYINAYNLFDKFFYLRGEVNLALAALYAYMIALRCKDAIIFNTSVFFASLFYEVLGFWLYLIVAIHLLTHSALSITNVVLIFASGLLLASFIILICWQKIFGQITTKDTARQFTKPIDYMIYVYRMHKVIESDNPSSF